MTNPWSYPYFHSWLKHFTVVQWDQRGAGRTLAKTGEAIAPTMTVERMMQDGIELAEYLRKRLNKQRIVLVGHSWGSVFGVLMAKARPDLFHAFVGTGQVIDFQQANRVAYDLALQTARLAADPKGIAELQAVGPPPYVDGKAGNCSTNGGVCAKARRLTGFSAASWVSHLRHPVTQLAT